MRNTIGSSLDKKGLNPKELNTTNAEVKGPDNKAVDTSCLNADAMNACTLNKSTVNKSTLNTSTLNASQVVKLFNECFATSSDLSQNTYLVGMANEPIYLPSHMPVQDFLVEHSNGDNTDNNKIAYLGSASLNTLPQANLIFFNRDYLASALHEVSHWCIAGDARRRLVDYGYWYTPDNRNAEQQAQFEQVEIKPQALEWAFSIACGKQFKVSCDNFFLQEHDSTAFEQKVYEQLCHYKQYGFPTRAQAFIDALNHDMSSPLISTVPCNVNEMTSKRQ